MAAAALTLDDSSALAAGRVVTTFPAGGKPTKSGLLLQIDQNWVESAGYRPVRITAQCTPPAGGDRTLTVTLTMLGYASVLCRATANLELPAGASTANILMPVPRFSVGVMSIEVVENGRQVDALSGHLSSGFNYQQKLVDSTLLHVSESTSATDSSAFFGNLTSPASTPAMQVGPAKPLATPATTATPTDENYFITRTAAEMPEEWIDLTALDLVVMSSDELALMAHSAPRAWQAVRDWTAAGGNLCIYGAGDRQQRRAEIDGFLGDWMPGTEKSSEPGA